MPAANSLIRDMEQRITANAAYYRLARGI